VSLKAVLEVGILLQQRTTTDFFYIDENNPG
jgi:hypothetical protein